MQTDNTYFVWVSSKVSNRRGALDEDHFMFMICPPNTMATKQTSEALSQPKGNDTCPMQPLSLQAESRPFLLRNRVERMCPRGETQQQQRGNGKTPPITRSSLRLRFLPLFCSFRHRFCSSRFFLLIFGAPSVIAPFTYC